MLRPRDGNSVVSFDDTLLNFGLWITSFCVKKNHKDCKQYHNDKQTSGISGVFTKGGGRITLDLIENVA